MHSHRALRPLPSYQCVMFLSFSQCLSLLVKELSLTQPTWLCYSLATLTHYTVLVTLSWMIVYPVLEAIKVFKVIWYEKSWFITPFAVIAWGELECSFFCFFSNLETKCRYQYPSSSELVFECAWLQRYVCKWQCNN